MAEAVARDEFVDADMPVRTVATVTALVQFDVTEVAQADDIADSSRVEGQVVGVEWSAPYVWSVGEQIPAKIPSVGSSATWAVEDSWPLEVGQSVVVGVDTETTLPGTNGFVRFVLDSDGTPGDAHAPTQGLNGRIQGLLRSAAARSGKAGFAPTVALLQDARDWIDRVNTVSPEERPGGLAAAEGPAVSPVSESALDAFLKLDPQTRQLPVSASEIPELSDGVGQPMAEGEVVVVLEENAQADFDFIAVRYPSVGVLGPYSLDTATNTVGLHGVIPLRGAAQVLGWSAPEPAPEASTTLATVQIPAWNPDTEYLVLRPTGGGWQLTAEDTASVDALITDRSASADPGPRSENE